MESLSYCWGRNYVGSLGAGDPPNTFSASPKVVSGSLQFAQIDAGLLHTCGVTTDSVPYCWGDNNSGQLGTGDQDFRNVPTAVGGGLRFVNISNHQGSGGQIDQNSCALTIEGAAWCWGGNQGGALGNGSPDTWSLTPVPVSGGHVFRELSATGGFVCAITTGAELYCWGRGARDPVLVSGGLQWLSISVGPSHNCGISTTAHLYCWGANDWGELGLGTAAPEPTLTPTPVTGGRTWRQVTVGEAHTCAIEATGGTWCWGYGELGELGIGDQSPGEPGTYFSSIPLAVATVR